MAGLLGEAGDFIFGDDTTRDEYGQTQADRRMPYWSGLVKAGLLAAAGGQRMMPEQRAQYIAQAGGALAGIPQEIVQARSESAKQLLAQQTIATNKNKLANQARIQAYAGTPEGQQALAGLKQHEQFAAKVALDSGDIDAFSRIMGGIGTHEARAATLALQEKALELKRLQQEQGGLFKGSGPEVQMYNFLSRADPGSQEYLIAYNYLSKPRTLPDGSKVEGMDLRAYPVPTFSRLPGTGAPAGTPPAPQPPPPATGDGGPAPAPGATPPVPALSPPNGPALSPPNGPAPGGTPPPPPPAPGVPGPVVAPPPAVPAPAPPAPAPGARPPAAPPPNLTPDQIGLTLRPGTSITQPNGTAITRGLDGTVRIDYPDGQSTTQAPNSPKVTEGAPKLDPTDARKLNELKTEQAKLNVTGQDFLKEWTRATPGDRAKAMLGQPTPLSAAWTNFAMLAKGSALFNLGVITGPDKQLLESALANPASLRSMGVSEADVEKQMRKLLAILDTGVREHEKNLLNPPKAPKPGAAAQPKVRNYNPATGQFE